MILTAVNSAMNTRRRDTGFSPSQAVWGRDPDLPEHLKNGPQDEHVDTSSAEIDRELGSTLCG